MKRFILLLGILFLHSSLTAQMPPPPLLQPGESWTKLWSVSYDFQTNGSVRYLVQDPANSGAWCSILMAQQDSNTAAGVQRYIYYSYSKDYGNEWLPDVLNLTASFGFPCITVSNGIPVIACHQSAATGSFVYKDLLFGGFAFFGISGVPSPAPIWPHISSSTNGNLIMAASPNDGSTFIGARTTYNGSAWSPYVNMPSINGPSGNFDVFTGPSGRAAIIGTDYIGNSALYWFRSSDNGVTFDAGTLIMNYIMDGADTLYANLVGGYQGVYDNTGNAHIVFTAYNFNADAIFPNGNTTAFVKPKIYHWSSGTNTFTQVAGKFNIPALTDTITQSLMVPLSNPTITISPGGKLTCAFTAFLRGNTQVVENGDVVNAGEIFYSVSESNGASWSVPQNITQTPAIEEKYPSLPPKLISDSIRIFYLRDMRAGNWVNVTGWGKAPVYGIFNDLNTDQVPAVPLLTSPLNNSSYVSLTPLMSWQTVFSADSFTVQLSPDTAFSSLTVNHTGTATEYQIPSATLDYNSVYYWRVRAANSNGAGPWSLVWNFRTETFLPPAPVLLSPANGSTEVSLTPTLSWNSAPTATGYNVQLSSDTGFLSPLINLNNVTATQYSVPASVLNINSTYYWRISSVNSNGTGPWASFWSFTTVSLPAAPVLTAPPNGATGVPLTTLLNWNNVPNTLRYRIILSTDSTFSTFIVNDSSLTISQYVAQPPVLNYFTKYFWKVNAINNAGSGPWSETWNFTTRLKTGLDIESGFIPTEYGLFNNYPNPFNPATRIKFDLPESGITLLTVFDINGREVTQLINERLNAGRYEFEFSAGKYNLSSGIYFYKLISGKFIETKQMVLIK